MKTSTPCPNCGHPLASNNCSSCGSVLALSLSDVHLLRQEVLSFQEELSEKSRDFLKRINLLEKGQKLQVPEKEPLPDPPTLKTEKEIPAPPEPLSKKLPEPVKPAPLIQPIPVPIPIPLSKAPKTSTTSPYSTTPIRKPEIKQLKPKPRPISPPKEKEELSFILSLLLSPIHQGASYIKGVFNHYKEAGRLPVFFLSLGGIIAMLFGVGYLMQLGVNYFIEILSPATLEGLKIGFAMATAGTILGFGIRFSKKEAKYRDFSAALLGLGIAGFYLIFYFLPESIHFPLFKVPLFSLSLIALTAFLGSWLALKHEARVLTVVSFLGAALIPLAMNAQILGELYLGFLGLLSVSTLYISRKISWNPLRMICLVVVLGVIEWMVYASGNKIATPALLLALHGFAYLFIINTLWKGTGWLKSFKSEDIFMVSSTLSLLILNSLTLANQHGLDTLIGYIFMGNAAIWAVFCASSFKKISDSLRWLCFLISGAFLALAAFLLLDQNYLALGLGIEAVLLLSFGFRFSLERVRMEAYALAVFVLCRCFYGMRDFGTHWDLGLWSDSFMHLLILGGVLAALLFHLRKFPIATWEKDLRAALGELLFMWTIATGFLIVSRYLGIYTLNFAIVPMIFVMYWGNKQGLFIGERIGWLLGLSFGVSYLISAIEVGGFHFHEQTWAAKIALIEAFGMLWFMQYLYKQWDKDSGFYKVSCLFRKVFFVLLPLVYLPSVARRFPEFLPFAAWGSVLFAYFLAKYRQRIELVIETHVLVALASVLLFFPLSVASVSMGVVVLGLIFGMEKGLILSRHKASPFKHIQTYSFFYLALAFSLSLMKISDDLILLCSPILALYFQVLYAQRSKIAPLRKYGTLLYRFFMFWSLSCTTTLIYMFDNKFYLEGIDFGFLFLTCIVLIVATLFWSQLYARIGQWKMYQRTLQSRFLFLQVLTMLTYGTLLSMVTGNPFGMGLTLTLFVHAILLLYFSFEKEKSWMQKLAFMLLALAFAKLILFDFRHFNLAYKIGVSILSGALMLLGARMYLKKAV